jgi:hypothetical protein
MTPDPLADPVLARRLAAIRTLCLAVVVGLVGIAAGVSLIVGYALDGQPLAGNAVTVQGLPLPTLVAATLAVVAVGVARRLGRHRPVPLPHPELAGSPEAHDARLNGFAAAAFAEFAVAAGTGFACCALMHVTADYRLLAVVGGLVLYLAARFPTAARARRWLAPPTA